MGRVAAVTWWVRNVREMQWRENELGAYAAFDGGQHEEFPELGVNLVALQPGQPMTMYHREPLQEGFLILRGECLLIAEGQKVPLRQWDYCHCPRGVTHAIVGAGDGPSLVLAVGNRVGEKGVVYPRNETAAKHGASVERETERPSEAYARFSPDADIAFREELLG